MNEYTYAEISLGMQISFKQKITKEMEDVFRELTHDINPLHQDDAFAKTVSMGRFISHVSFGMLTASLLSTVAGVFLPGKYSLIHSIDDVSFLKPVYADDELTICAEVIDKNDALKLIVLRIVMRNQKKMLVSRAKMKVLVMK